MLWLLLASCGTDTTATCTDGWAMGTDGVCFIDPLPLASPALLRRMSLDLRGRLPTAAELDAAEADPTAVEAMRDDFLDDPALEERLVALMGEHWRTLVDDVTLQAGEAGFERDEEYTYERSVGEEPLRLMAYVAVNDLPWSEIVTADYTLANEVLAQIWPLDYPDGELGWQEARYTDGRPSAGVLATNGLWWRYSTNESNANRSRASAISSLLLCEDYLTRPVSFASAQGALDEAAIASAIADDPSCANCHSTLEPLAAALFGFWWFEEHNLGEMSWYHASREPLGELVLGVGPAWFGTPIGGLADVGEMIADDPRFTRCAAETAAEALWRREVTLADFDTISALDDAFVRSGMSMRTLLKAVTDTPTYRAGSWPEGVSQDAAAGEMTRRMLSPDQLSTALEDLTGFTWTHDGTHMLRNDSHGYRVLSGGVDGVYVTRPQGDPGLTWGLVLQRLSEAAASHAAQSGVIDGQDATDPTEALAVLHWRLYASRPDDAQLDALAALWTAIEAIDGAEAAWAGVLSAMLRDPDFASY